MKLFDANTAVGSPIGGAPEKSVTADELLLKMDSLSIEKSLVWHTAQLDGGPVTGNPLLTEVVKTSDRLYGTWAILPPQTGEFVTPSIFDEMRKNRIYALRAFPEDHKYLLRRSVFGEFLDEVSVRHIPFLYSVDDRRDRWNELYTLMEEYPDLTCIVCDVGIWGTDRFTWPLVESFPNLYIETSYVSLEAGGLEASVSKYGPGRFIFGSGFPFRYHESAIMDLRHSKMSEEDREMIAWGNLNNLLEGVVL
ncbi:MAG: amidohydrolase family protein [Armatimonadota bacterium]